MHTVFDNIKDDLLTLQSLFEDILLNHSSLYYNQNIPAGGYTLVIVGGNYSYKDIGEGGHQLQSKLMSNYRHLSELFNVLLKEQTKDTKQEFTKLDKQIWATIEQERTHCKNVQEAFNETKITIEKLLNLLHRLHDPAEGNITYIPDTNALLYNPDLETWSFSNNSKFTILLLPTVLSELDSLKMNHKNEGVRKKSEKLIRKIKEYRRRGKLNDGVPIIRNKINLQSIAIEPDMNNTLSWLKADNNDDRILAGIIEVMRLHPRSSIIAISRDINFQNKSEYSNIPFVEPPDP